jgi:hypothetical protein
MPAANITTMRHILRDQFQSTRVLANNPFHAEAANLFAESLDRKLEFPCSTVTATSS